MNEIVAKKHSHNRYYGELPSFWAGFGVARGSATMTISRRIVNAILAIMLLMPSTARASCQGTDAPFCSRTFYASGECTGGDKLASLKAEGESAVEMTQPWEPIPIVIVGIELTVVSGPLAYAFAGNSATPDVMMMLGAGETHGRVFYPDGLGFLLPAMGALAHIDLHVSCLPNPVPARRWWRRSAVAAEPRTFGLFYTVYYRPVSASPRERP